MRSDHAYVPKFYIGDLVQIHGMRAIIHAFGPLDDCGLQPIQLSPIDYSTDKALKMTREYRARHGHGSDSVLLLRRADNHSEVPYEAAT